MPIPDTYTEYRTVPYNDHQRCFQQAYGWIPNGPRDPNDISPMKIKKEYRAVYGEGEA